MRKGRIPIMSLENTEVETDRKDTEKVLTGILGSTIKRRRQEIGYSLDRLSQGSNVSRGMLGLIESGKTTPSIGILWRVARALRTPISDLIPDFFLRTPKLIKREECKVIVLEKGGIEIRFLQREIQEKLGLYEVVFSGGTYSLPSVFQSQNEQAILTLSGKFTIEFRDRTLNLETGDNVLFLGSDLLHLTVETNESIRLHWIESPLR